MLAAVMTSLALALGASATTPGDAPTRRNAASAKSAPGTERRSKSSQPRRSEATSTTAGSELARARAQLTAVKRDPSKRRYRDRWERAIAALEKAARGRDTGPALLDAARGRYALYRFSQVESDRTAALALARRAEKEGVREATALRNAIRSEMGEPRSPAPAPPRRPAAIAAAPPARSAKDAPAPTAKSAPARPARAAPVKAPRPSAVAAEEPRPRDLPLAAPPPPPATEEPSVDEILERALAADDSTATGEEESSEALVSDLKTWSNQDYTRIALYLSRSATYERVDLPATDGAPRRVALDLKPARLMRALGREVGDTLVRSVHASQLEGDTVRVVVALAGDEDLTVFPLDEPARLIVDVGAAPRRTVSGPPAPGSGEPTAAPQRQGTAAPAPGRELAYRGPIRRVIVDAGHGGHDTGAIGPTGVREKDVTLAMARRLERRLRARGYEVVLTRRDDRYVPLEERTAIANARHGDLFVSVHANAHPRRDRRGVETYILDVTSDRYAARLAARENGALGDGAANIPVLRRILSDLEAKVSVEASRRVAVAVQQELCTGLRARGGDVRDLGVKSALFHVLLGARMPAVLVETAFISNAHEERRLASGPFQEEVANAIVRAVERVSPADARVASTMKESVRAQ